MRWIWVVLPFVCWGPAALAQDWCSPKAGSYYAVTGVAPNDVLNLRAGPGSNHPVVARVKPKETGLRIEGGVDTGTVACRNACTAVALGLTGARPLVELECVVKGALWVRVKEPGGVRGWALARFLRAGGTAPAPQPLPVPPSQAGRFNYLCPGLGNLLLVTRGGSDDATLYAPRGETFPLVRERGAKQELAYRGRDNNREMFIRGTAREVSYADAKGRVTRCSGIR